MPELKYKLPKGYLSPSAVGEYLKCAYGYYLKYIEGVRPIKASESLMAGTSVHAALELNYTSKLSSGSDLATPTVVATFQDALSDQLRRAMQECQSPDWDTCESDARATGALALTKYMEIMAPSIIPIATELAVEGSIGDVPVQARIDLLRDDQGNRRVSDFKHSSKPKTIGDAVRSPQLGAYSILEQVDRVELITLPKTKSPKPVAASVTLTDADRQRTENLFKSVAQAITAGVFPYTDPASWACGEKWCSVWHACPQGGKLRPC